MNTDSPMKINFFTLIVLGLTLMSFLGGCAKAYKPSPVPFKSPNALGNAVTIDGALIGVKAYDDREEAKKIFGFDIIEAGLLPIQVVFDNKGSHSLEINGSQSFLEDLNKNMWPVLDRKTAYARATAYTKSDEILSKSGYGGVMGAAAGALVGSAIGVVSGSNVGTAALKGAAVGGTVGTLAGAASGHDDGRAGHAISRDLNEKSLENKIILPGTLAYGILFYPAEAQKAGVLQLRIMETDSGITRQVFFDLARNTPGEVMPEYTLPKG